MSDGKIWHYRVPRYDERSFRAFVTEARAVAEEAWRLHCYEYNDYADGRVTVWADDQPRRTYRIKVSMVPDYEAFEIGE